MLEMIEKVIRDGGNLHIEPALYGGDILLFQLGQFRLSFSLLFRNFWCLTPLNTFHKTLLLLTIFNCFHNCLNAINC